MLIEDLLAKSCLVEPEIVKGKEEEKEVFILEDSSDENGGRFCIIKRKNESILNFKIDECGSFRECIEGKIIDNILLISVIKNKNATNLLFFIEFKSTNEHEIRKISIEKFDNFIPQINELYRISDKKLLDYLLNDLNSKRESFKIAGLIVHSNEDLENELFNKNYKSKAVYSTNKGNLEIKEIEGVKIFLFCSKFTRRKLNLDAAKASDKKFRKFARASRLYRKMPL